MKHYIQINSNNIISENKGDLLYQLDAHLRLILGSLDFVPETNIEFTNITKSDFEYKVFNIKNQKLANSITRAIEDNKKSFNSIFIEFIIK
jgi:hypothetical protein